MREPPNPTLTKNRPNNAGMSTAWKKAIIRSLVIAFLIVVMGVCLWMRQPHEGVSSALFASIAAFFAEDYADSRAAGFLVGSILNVLAALLWLFLLFA